MVDYSITDKVTSIVTDNGSNFVTAFKEYSKEVVEKRAAKQVASENKQTGSQPSKYQYEEDDEEQDSDEEDLTHLSNKNGTALNFYCHFLVNIYFFK